MVKQLEYRQFHDHVCVCGGGGGGGGHPHSASPQVAFAALVPWLAEWCLSSSYISLFKCSLT